MTASKTCPICDSKDMRFNIDDDVYDFLWDLRKKELLNEFLRVCKVHLNIIRQGAPTAAVVTKVISSVKTEIKKSASAEFSHVTEELPDKIQKALQDKIPDPEQLHSLVKVLPELTLAVQELLRKQEVPQIKGEEGEQELAEELSSYFPEDDVERLGKSGETDILLRPRINGLTTNYEVIVESKKRKTWRRDYIEQIREHMANRGARYGILAVEKMPKGANGYLTEFVDEGTIFITSRDYAKLAYGALRAILLSEFTLGRKATNLELALADRRVDQAIKNAFKTAERLESIKKCAKTITKNSEKIEKDASKADGILRSSLQSLQQVINRTLTVDSSEVQISEISVS